MSRGMALKVALRSLALQPVRSAVLAGGFGSGIAAMAGLLGIGQVILEQSRSPQLAGGGEVVIHGVAGDVRNARFVTSAVLSSQPLVGRTRAASPSISEALYLVGEGNEPLRVYARGGIPSLERALDDYETARSEVWRDTAADRRFGDPDAADVLRSMDRFHAIPAGREGDDSWAEWLYFNGGVGEERFYLTFLVGPESTEDRRSAGVRLQWERDGRIVSYSDRAEVVERDVLEGAPDLRIGASEVRLEGLRYRIRLHLWREGATRRASPDLSGEIVLQAAAGRSVPPFRVQGARGWVSGYVVPVLEGVLAGALEVEGRRVALDGGRGYHDHNWGFWKDVSWRWGQVAGPRFSFVYGRILPPMDVVDPVRFPGLLVALGPDGPAGFTTDVSIEETDDPETGRPRRIVVRGSGDALDITIDLDVRTDAGTRVESETPGGTRNDVELVQMRADGRVVGRVGKDEVDFTAHGSAETFRPGRR